MKEAENLQTAETQALNIPVFKNCTTCKFTGGRYTSRKCCYCSRDFSMWKQR